MRICFKFFSFNFFAMRGSSALPIILLGQNLSRSLNFALSYLKGRTSYKMASIFLISIIHFSLFLFFLYSWKYIKSEKFVSQNKS